MRKWKGRKPLTDVSNRNESNGGRVLKKAPPPSSFSSCINGTRNNNNNNNNNNKDIDDETAPFVSKGENDAVLQGEELDRLLLVHSHLSSLTHQIDELVSKAMKLNTKSNDGRKEIESFTLFLSHILSSLKPWVPRFDDVLSLPSPVMENQVGGCVADKSISTVDEVDNLEAGTPEETTMDSLISPSPLVSWRADCHIEQGRQLFLLTPLPTPKAPSQKRRDLSSHMAVQMFAPTPTVEIPLQFHVSRDTDGDLREGPTIKQTSTKLDSVATEVRSTFTCGILSTPLFVKRDPSVLVVTPCLKMSPPKSCVMLEPISEPSCKVHDNVRKSTPFPVGVHSTVSESSSGERSEDLGAKYPELLGIQRAFLTRTGTYIDTSPDWSFSPPKTCVLLEPPTGKAADVVARDCHAPISAPIVNEQTKLSLKGFDGQGACEQTKISNEDCRGGSLAHTERTPIWKEAESTMRTARHPGENTLKRELWTKFEAASTYGLRLNVSAFQGNAQKGFLDMLDEASCDDKSVMPEGLK